MAGIFGRKKVPIKDPFDKWKNQDLRELLKEMKTELSRQCGSETLRIVLCGPTGSGKSSTVNNIISTRKGRLVQVALTGGDDEHVTEKYTEYKLPLSDVQDDNAPLVVCDTRGIDKDVAKTSVEAVKAAVAGKYAQKETMKRTTDDQEGQSTKKKQAAYIIFVFDATSVETELPAKDTENSVIYQNMKTVHKFAMEQSIPLSIFLTKCDRLDASVGRDITKLYKSVSVEKARNHISQRFQGLPLNRIFPIVNYTNQLETNDAMILHTLFALKCIVADVESSLADVVPDT